MRFSPRENASPSMQSPTIPLSTRSPTIPSSTRSFGFWDGGAVMLWVYCRGCDAFCCAETHPTLRSPRRSPTRTPSPPRLITPRTLLARRSRLWMAPRRSPRFHARRPLFCGNRRLLGSPRIGLEAWHHFLGQGSRNQSLDRLQQFHFIFADQG
jgi:hypothetical protein